MCCVIKAWFVYNTATRPQMLPRLDTPSLISANQPIHQTAVIVRLPHCLQPLRIALTLCTLAGRIFLLLELAELPHR